MTARFLLESAKNAPTFRISRVEFRKFACRFHFPRYLPDCSSNFSNSALTFKVSGLLLGFPPYLFDFHVTFLDSALLVEGLLRFLRFRASFPNSTLGFAFP